MHVVKQSGQIFFIYFSMLRCSTRATECNKSIVTLHFLYADKAMDTCVVTVGENA